jgi:hypothetical protein
MSESVLTAKFKKKFAAGGGLNNNIFININIKYSLVVNGLKGGWS